MYKSTFYENDSVDEVKKYLESVIQKCSGFEEDMV